MQNFYHGNHVDLLETLDFHLAKWTISQFVQVSRIIAFWVYVLFCGKRCMEPAIEDSMF